MNHIKMYVLLIVSVLFLFGCNQANETSNNENSKNANNTEPFDQAEIADVFQKAADAHHEINNMKADTQAKVGTISNGREAEYTTQEATFITFDPFIIHSINKANDPLETESIESEMYVTDDQGYINGPRTNGWTIFPLQEIRMYIDVLTITTDIQFTHYQDYTEHFTMEEDENAYIIYFEGENELYLDAIVHGVPDMIVPSEEIHKSDDIDFNGTMEMYIDKDTFLLTKLKKTFEQTREENGMTYEDYSDLEVTYSEFNELDEIGIPEEVIAEASE